jgi:hypothetical protein
VGEAELEGMDGVAAEAVVEAGDDEVAGRAELIAPAVVLDEQMEGAAGEDGGLGAGGELAADGFGPEGGGKVPAQAAPQPVAIERALQDAAHRLGAPAGKEMPCAQERLRKSTSCSAGISSSSR